jgi:hypothetical protein
LTAVNTLHLPLGEIVTRVCLAGRAR